MASSFDNLVLRTRARLPSEHSREDLVRMYMPRAVSDFGLPTDWPKLDPTVEYEPTDLCSWLADTVGYLYLCVRQITTLYADFRPELDRNTVSETQWSEWERLCQKAAYRAVTLQKAIIAEWNLHNRLLALLGPHMVGQGADAADPKEIVSIDEVPPPLPADGDADDHPGLTESIRQMAQKYRPPLETKEKVPSGEDLKKAIERAVGPE